MGCYLVDIVFTCARLHAVGRIVQLKQKPYSSNLTPSDYHLFLHLKEWLRLQNFENDDDVVLLIS